LHLVTDDYPAGCAGHGFEAADMIDGPLARLEPLFADHREDFDELVDNAARLRPMLDKLSQHAPAYGICHGDVHANNFHLHNQGCGLIDFEYFGYGWRVFDIATFFNTRLIEQGRTEQTRSILDAFLDGYQSVRRLSPSELEVLPAFVILRQLWLLGTGARYLPKSTLGLGLFQYWVFQQCLPFIRAWLKQPW